MIATVNRLTAHLDPPLPRDPQVRQDHISDAVMRAVSAAANLLSDDDPAVVLKAAKLILDLEKTRLRHGRAILGAPNPYMVELAKELGPIGGSHREVLDDEDFADEEELPAVPNEQPMRVPQFTREPDVQPDLDAERREAADPSQRNDEFQTWLKQFRKEVGAPTPPAGSPPPAGDPHDRDTFHLSRRE